MSSVANRLLHCNNTLYHRDSAAVFAETESRKERETRPVAVGLAGRTTNRAASVHNSRVGEGVWVGEGRSSKYLIWLTLIRLLVEGREKGVKNISCNISIYKKGFV